MALRRLIATKWGLSRDILKQIYEGAILPCLLNGVQCWGDALEKDFILKMLQGVQRLAAAMITRAFSTASTEAIVALAGITPIDLKADEMIVKSFLHTPLNARLKDLPSSRTFCPHLRHLSTLLIEMNLSYTGAYETPVLDHELPYPPHRVKSQVLLGKRKEFCANHLLLPGRCKIFSGGSKKDTEVGAAFAAIDGNGKVVGMGMYKLPPHATIYQAEGIAISKGAQWAKSQNPDLDETSRKFALGDFDLGSDSRSVLSSVRSSENRSRLVAKCILPRLEQHTQLFWLPSHVGHKGNELADWLANQARTWGTSVSVPRVTRA